MSADPNELVAFVIPPTADTPRSAEMHTWMDRWIVEREWQSQCVLWMVTGLGSVTTDLAGFKL